jgi:transposase
VGQTTDYLSMPLSGLPAVAPPGGTCLSVMEPGIRSINASAVGLKLGIGKVSLKLCKILIWIGRGPPDHARLNRGSSASTGGWAKKSSSSAEALGRSRGGLTTKIHALVDALGNPLRIHLTPGQWADSPQALPLLMGFSPLAVADKAYDTNTSVQTLTKQGIQSVIPPKANRIDQREYDENRYEDRNKIERFFNLLKGYRRIATRYDKTATSFLAFVHLACALIWLR